MTEKLIEEMAARVAVACNGGEWGMHYTPKQRALWVSRVKVWFTP